MTPQAMGEVIEKLEKMHLLKRVSHPNHRRVYPAVLLPEGIQVLEQCDAKVAELEATMLHDLDDAPAAGDGACPDLGRPGARRRADPSTRVDDQRRTATASAAPPICSVQGVTKRFGAVAAVDDVRLDFAEGSLTCLIGPNGAGKSTLLGCMSGFLPVDEGRIVVDGNDITNWPAHRRARAGTAVCFQTTRVLEYLDVLGNAAVGCHTWTRAGFVEGMLRPPWQWREERVVKDEARAALELVGLADQADSAATTLPIGQLRLLSVARALAQRPRLLLLDEPAAGLRAAEKDRLAQAHEHASRARPDADPRRARHEVRRIARRPRRRSRPGPRHRRRNTGRGASRRAGDRGLPRDRPPYDRAARARRRRRSLRPCRRGRRRVAARRRGRARRADRPERRGQELAAERCLRRPRARGRARPRRRPRCDGLGARPDRRARADPGARGTAGVPDPAGRGEPPARRVRQHVPHRDRHLDAPLSPPPWRGS